MTFIRDLFRYIYQTIIGMVGYVSQDKKDILFVGGWYPICSGAYWRNDNFQFLTRKEIAILPTESIHYIAKYGTQWYLWYTDYWGWYEGEILAGR